MPMTFISLCHFRPKCVSQDGKCRQAVVEGRGSKVFSMAPTSGRLQSDHVDLPVARLPTGLHCLRHKSTHAPPGPGK